MNLGINASYNKKYSLSNGHNLMIGKDYVTLTVEGYMVIVLVLRIFYNRTDW
jgi:hypothetical protein